MECNFTITDFDKAHQPLVDELYDSIQAEYPQEIYGKPVKKLCDVADLPDRKYWVMLNEENKLIATVGIVLLKDHIAALKSMMLATDYRGKGLSEALLQHAIIYAAQQGCRTMLLGTMTQFVAAQKFYMKNGFEPISKDELPGDFHPNPVDSLFYRRRL